MFVKYDKVINAENMRIKDLTSLLQVFKIVELGDSVPDNVRTFNNRKGNPAAYKIYTSTASQDIIKFYLDEESEILPANLDIKQGKKNYLLSTALKEITYVYQTQKYIIRLTIQNLPDWFINQIIKFIPYHTSELLAEYTIQFHRVLYYEDIIDLLKTPNTYTAGEVVRVLKYNKFYSVTILQLQSVDSVQGYNITIVDNYNNIKYIIDTVNGYLTREEKDGTLETMRLYMYKNTYEGIIEARLKD